MKPDDFNPSEIEQMQVEFKACPHCNGEACKDNGIFIIACPMCFGAGEIPVKEGEK